jgi:hypothetical protein
MWASPFTIALLNLCNAISVKSANYMPRDVAYDWLKNHTKEDFGYDANAWEQWGKAHDEFYPGWAGISSMVDRQHP